MINTEEECVDDNGQHDNIFKRLRLDNLEALQPETIDWFNWNNLWLCMDKKSLNLNPFLLFFSEIISTLSLLDFLIELLDNNGYKQVHDEERSEENVQNEED